MTTSISTTAEQVSIKSLEDRSLYSTFLSSGVPRVFAYDPMSGAASVQTLPSGGGLVNLEDSSVEDDDTFEINMGDLF